MTSSEDTGTHQGNSSNNLPSDSDAHLRALLHRTASEAVAFKHQFPPRFPISSRTYLGGLPTAPADFRWPRAPDGTPYTFMGQVDCSELPAFQLRNLLPESGVLHFFVSWALFDVIDEAHIHPNLVVFSSGTAESWHEVRPPDDLPPCYGSSYAKYYFRWLEHTDRRMRDFPRTFAKKGMTMGVVRTFFEDTPEEFDDNLAERYQQILEQELTAEHARFHGDPVAMDLLPGWQDSLSAPTILRPTKTFPAAWIDIEIFSGLFLEELRERGIAQIERGEDTAGRPWPPDPAALQAAYEDAIAAANTWVEEAREKGLMSPVPEADKLAFWNWLDGMNALSIDRVSDCRSARLLNRLSREAVSIGARILLSAGEAPSSLVPPEMMGELLMDHSVLVQNNIIRATKRHQMLGAGVDVQGAPRRHRLAGGYQLLMQLDSDRGVPWLFGDCGVLQYWIRESDLRERRFDKVHLTIEGH